ncbi:MAG: diacylglycerol kinase family protein [Pseudomonadales bacterium]
MRKPFSLKDRATSFVYAGRGIVTLLRTQHNTWLHCVATLLVAGAAYALDVTRNDCLWLLLAVVLVWLTEAFNTAVEFVADAVSTDYRLEIKHAKDVAAAAVLLAAMFAVVVGLAVFIPYL